MQKEHGQTALLVILFFCLPLTSVVTVWAGTHDNVWCITTIYLICKASFKSEVEMNPSLVALACTLQESFPFVRSWYLDMSILQIQ